jgi:hypothetical protein
VSDTRVVVLAIPVPRKIVSAPEAVTGERLRDIPVPVSVTPVSVRVITVAVGVVIVGPGIDVLGVIRRYVIGVVGRIVGERIVVRVIGVEIRVVVVVPIRITE